MVELQQPRHLVHRVDGRDLRILVDHPYVYLRRDDVEAIAGVPPWATGESLLLDEDQVVDVAGGEFYPLEVAIDRARHDSLTPARAAAFLAWLEEYLPHILDPDLLEGAHRTTGFAQSYTVAAAARILDRDPLIRTGRHRLFEQMAALGWIDRDAAGDWVVQRVAHDRDWLVSRALRVRGRRYLQIHVTPAGLVELRRRLACQPTPSPLTPVIPSPPLFD